MELEEAIMNRRSIRAYKNRELPADAMGRLIEAARHAPSAGNGQPWRFVVCVNAEIKHGLSVAAFGQKCLEDASAVIVVCVDLKDAAGNYGERGLTLYCYQDTAAAIENILLTAVSLGLGTCWIGAFREDDVRRVIHAPSDMRPVALIPVGYPDESPLPRPRKPAEAIVRYERF
ncbi:MAG: nitroreductase family protein [Candidatus Bathyarchaeota archaeon]|nr:nitroreductase family protein [Candidatus Bathyarchaeota archaeon]